MKTQINLGCKEPVYEAGDYFSIKAKDCQIFDHLGSKYYLRAGCVYRFVQAPYGRTAIVNVTSASMNAVVTHKANHVATTIGKENMVKLRPHSVLRDADEIVLAYQEV